MLTTFFFFQKNGFKSFFAPTLLAAGLFLSTANGCFAQEVFNLSNADSASTGDADDTASSASSTATALNILSSSSSKNDSQTIDTDTTGTSATDTTGTSATDTTTGTDSIADGWANSGSNDTDTTGTDSIGSGWANSGSNDTNTTGTDSIGSGWANSDSDSTEVNPDDHVYYDSDTSTSTDVTIPETAPPDNVEAHVQQLSGSQTTDEFYKNAGFKVDDQHARAADYKALTNTDPYATEVSTAVVGSYINTRNDLNEMSEKIRDVCKLDQFKVTINRASFYSSPNAYNNFEAKTKTTLVDAFDSLCNDKKYQKKKNQYRKRIKNNIYEVMFYHDSDRKGVAMRHQDGTVQIFANFNNNKEISKSLFKTIIMSVIPGIEVKRSQVESVVRYQNQFDQDSDLQVFIGDSDMVGDSSFLNDY